MSVRVLHGDCLLELPKLEAESVHAVVTDPPYELNFMAHSWDRTGVAFTPETWRHVLRVLKSGGHMVCFGGTRTHHRMMCAIEDAGFEVRDTLQWIFGSGFPKSLNIGQAIDKAAGVTRKRIPNPRGGTPRSIYAQDEWTRKNAATYSDQTSVTAEAAQWSGWGSALKPSYEPIILCRKPLDGTLASNSLKHGVGGLNIDACRVPAVDEMQYAAKCASFVGLNSNQNGITYGELEGVRTDSSSPLGRWPTNLLHDGSPEVMEAFARFGEKTSNPLTYRKNSARSNNVGFAPARLSGTVMSTGSTGTADRFFPCCPWSDDELRFYYSGKASAEDRAGSRHPTIKPLSLMRWLCKLICPPGGTVLDPFAGSGTTLLAADRLGFNAIGIEQDAAYVADIHCRLHSDAGLFSNVSDE